MNVTSSGVKGYEYQYSATLYVALLYLRKASALFVEKLHGEDATIELSLNGRMRVVEIQVKKTNKKVQNKDAAEWLCHFNQRSQTINLLHKILNADHSVLFIASGRCDDSTSILTLPVHSLERTSELSVSKGWQQDFLRSLSKVKFSGASKLITNRRKFCKEQADVFKINGNIADIVNQIIIWERLSLVDIETAAANILNRDFGIPQSLVESVELLLLKAVRQGRDEKIDILPLFSKIIQRHVGVAPVVDEGYIERKEEKDLKIILADEHVLLLTGVSLCGKSELARKFASEYYGNGYAYRICSDISQVDQFFGLNTDEDKICILEDPWGHISPIMESYEKWNYLEKLIRNKAVNHFLIVTSREEILRELFPNIKSYKTLASHCWVDITIQETSVVRSCWKILCDLRKLGTQVFQKIDKAIESQTGPSLQIGQLHYLSLYELTVLQETSVDELMHIARHNATEVANDLDKKEPAAAELLSIIAIGADTITGLAIEDLQYILSEDPHEYSFFPEGENMWVLSHNSQPDPFPAYSSDYVTITANFSELEHLEKRGFVFINNNRIFFTHPNYYEAGRVLFSSRSGLQQNRWWKAFSKTLACLNVNTALHATKQFSFLYNSFYDNHERILKLALRSLDSIFPSVEDESFIFLLSKLNDLEGEYKETIIQRLNSWDTSTSKIYWHGDTAYISRSSNDLIGHYFFQADIDKLNLTRQKFEHGDVVSSFEAWEFIRGLKSIYLPYLRNEILALLQYPEIFIRKSAASGFLSYAFKKSSLDIAEAIFSQQHPSVIYSAIRSCLVNWRSYPEPIKKALIELMIKAMSNYFVAIRCNHLFMMFAKEYIHDAIPWHQYSPEEKSELWNLWGTLFPVFVSQLPPTLAFDKARFGVTMDEAFDHLSEETGLKVLNAWFERSNRRIKAGRTPDENEMAIAAILMKFSGNDYIVRKDLFHVLLNVNDTSFLLSSLKWLIDYWEELHSSERDAIVALLHSNREDVRWIKAVAVSSERIPSPEIQIAVFGANNYFEKSSGEFVEDCDPDLLADCLRVYFGHPQPLWWLAVHGNNNTFWQPIVRHILIKGHQLHFEQCLHEFVSDGLNGFSSRWTDGMELWRQLCNTSEYLSIMVNRLMFEMTESNFVIDNTKEMWDELIAAYSARGQEDELINLFATKIELIQTGYNKNELFEVIDYNFLKKVRSTLFPDMLLLTGFHSYKQNSDPFALQEIVKMLVKNNFGPRFFITKKIFIHFFDKENDVHAIVDLINQLPDKIEEVGKEMANDQKQIDDYKLPNWIGAN